MDSSIRAAAQRALEALEKNTKHLPVHFDYHFEAITALRAALSGECRDCWGIGYDASGYRCACSDSRG